VSLQKKELKDFTRNRFFLVLFGFLVIVIVLSVVVAALVITTDKGLCGSLNTNIFKAVSSFISENKDAQFYTIGKKGRNFLAKLGKDLVADFENSDTVTFRTASQIGKLVSKSFIEGEIGSFSVIYPNFVSALRQEPKIMNLLPVNLESLKEFYDLALEDSKKKDQESSEDEEFLFQENAKNLSETRKHWLQ
jgi:F-type H+-transporting ATPase subunit gamma